MFSRIKAGQAHMGGTGSNILKSMAALALMGVLAMFLSSYFDGGAPEKPGTRAVTGAASAASPEALEVSQAPQAPPATPVVGHVITDVDLSIGREYIGRVEPIQTVQIRPRVAGQIESVHFREGSVVNEGDLLFTIDRAQYEATAALRRADLSKAQASLSRASKYNDRLKAVDKRSISANDLDMSASDVQQNRAAVEQARAALKLAEIDLGFTKIKAPITGRIGRVNVTKGNFVSSASAPLATIVQANPVRVSFAMPDREYMEQIKAFQSDAPVYKTTLTLADGTLYESSGVRDFEDNEMDSSTGAITLHLRFENKNGTLIPGSLVKVMTKPIKSRVAAIVPQEAVMSDAAGDYVYVIGDGNVVRRRGVTLGTEIGASREVVSGLTAGEKVIVSGLQNVRPESPVRPSYPAAGTSKTPADLARESGYDLPAIGQSGESSDEGKN
ncbi:MAG: efflux RND transporter periplasmic adaptor subunit [Synergistaceae bacterium]|jgi:RND family efflux transporter MFP subunit|nr:efflux RND transporter periplasmic adaptor subunit [Synergistaceae bacterium]